MTEQEEIDQLRNELNEKEAELKATTRELNRWKNHYDSKDCIRRIAFMSAGLLSIGVYQVRNLETGEFDLPDQIHMIYNSKVLAVLTPETAQLLGKCLSCGHRFIHSWIGGNPKGENALAASACVKCEHPYVKRIDDER